MKNQLLDEKYRPSSLDEVIGQEDIVRHLKKMKENPQHMIFYGGPGVGKTTTALAFMREVLGDSYNYNSLEMNASNERRIEDIRTKVKGFAQMAPVGDSSFKIILLDESDSITHDSQNALRRIIEDYSDTCRFILTANSIYRIIEPVQDRCIIYRFRKISADAIKERLKYIIEKEDVRISPNSLNTLSSLQDMRKAVKYLQQAIATDEDPLLGYEEDKMKAKVIIHSAMDGHLRDAIIKSKEFEASDLMDLMHEAAFDEENNKLRGILMILGESAYRVAVGANSIISINWMLSKLGNMK